jgi:hypothetical protein
MRPGAGIEGVITSEGRARYRLAIAHNPDRVILLCDRARILARSDRPDTMPS